MNIVGICSGGGHLTELLAVAKYLPSVQAIITERDTANRNQFVGVRLVPLVDPHRSVFRFFLNILHSLILLIELRPSVVISTGAGMTIPFFILSRFLGASTIFIESGARVKTPSLSGRLCYNFSDLFIIQSSELARFFPGAIHSSIIP